MPKQPAAAAVAEDDNAPGACYIADKQTGEQRCHLLTPTECTAQGGVFYGGPCGPFAEALRIAPEKTVVSKKKAAKKKTIPKKKPSE